jgi:hypothetical protein
MLKKPKAQIINKNVNMYVTAPAGGFAGLKITAPIACGIYSVLLMILPIALPCKSFIMLGKFSPKGHSKRKHTIPHKIYEYFFETVRRKKRVISAKMMTILPAMLILKIVIRILGIASVLLISVN